MSTRIIGRVLLPAIVFAYAFSTENANAQCNGGRGASGRSSSNAPGFGSGTSSTSLSSVPSIGGFPNNDLAYQRMVGMQQLQMVALQQQLARQMAELMSLRNQLAEERSAAQQQLLADRKEKALQKREERLATLRSRANGVKLVSTAAAATDLSP